MTELGMPHANAVWTMAVPCTEVFLLAPILGVAAPSPWDCEWRALAPGMSTERLRLRWVLVRHFESCWDGYSHFQPHL
jgi:hypothetical protein